MVDISIESIRTFVKDIVTNMKEFDPTSVGLKPDFKLTKLTEYKGCGCKVPREPLLALLEGLNDKDSSDALQKNSIQSSDNRIGVGMDSCVIPLQAKNSFLIQTTDFFFPLVEDPYMMGRITAANVLSDLYAMGVVNCDNMLMLLGVSTRLTEDERDIIIPLIIRGFKDCCFEAGTSVTGGQTVRNEWQLLGGVATSVCLRSEFIMPDGAEPGDVLILTKPLGIQLAVNAHQWLEQVPEKYDRIRRILNEQDTKKAYFRAMDSLARLNRTAAQLMHKFGAHGATDVTGFGLLGHAKNLARIQKKPVKFVISNLPIIAKLAAVSKLLGTGLLQGTQAETSGGLLIALPRDQAALYIREIYRLEGYLAWIIGIVEDGDRTAEIVDKPRVIEVPQEERDDQLW